MFEILRVHDDYLPRNQQRLRRCGDILLARIPTATEEQRKHLLSCLHDPVTNRFRSVLLVAESRGHVVGFALVMHEPVLRFCYLDYLCTAPGRSSHGIGGALYERIRQEALGLGAQGMFFECWPDDSALLHDPKELKEAQARLRFYERYGARPILNTYWDTPTPEGGLLTHLLFDDLGLGQPLRRERLRKVMEALLSRRYRHSVEPSEIQRYLDSVKDDPIRLRAPRYKAAEPAPVPLPASTRILVAVTDQHEEHHVHERGYYESPARMAAILPAIERSGLVRTIPLRSAPDKLLARVHKKDYLDFLAEVETGAFLPQTRAEVFAPRTRRAAPRSVAGRAGYYCQDGFTPLEPRALRAARRAVDCAYTATQAVIDGAPVSYSLARPPGHHAEPSSMGGYCYYANGAIAADLLARAVGRVAVLDLDYHHGNGQQEVFYRRRDVFTVSVHADPTEAYPFHAGFPDERGEGEGLGCNLNLPLALQLDGPGWLERGVEPAVRAVREFAPSALVLCLGFDAAQGDPTGSWSVRAEHFKRAGQLVGELGLPTVIVQEGGYRTRTLGANAVAFLTGLAKGRGWLVQARPMTPGGAAAG